MRRGRSGGASLLRVADATPLHCRRHLFPCAGSAPRTVLNRHSRAWRRTSGSSRLHHKCTPPCRVEGSQRPSPMNLAFEAPQAASNSTSAGSAQACEGPAPHGRRAQQSRGRSRSPRCSAPRRRRRRRGGLLRAVCAAGRVGALPAATTTVGSSHHISVMPLAARGPWGPSDTRPAAQNALTSLGYQCVYHAFSARTSMRFHGKGS